MAEAFEKATMSQAPGRVVTPLEGVPFAGWDAKKPIEAPLALHACMKKARSSTRLGRPQADGRL